MVGITTKSERKTEFQATTRVARANYQSLRDCCSKKVRAKATISPQIETSESERWEEARAEGAERVVA